MDKIDTLDKKILCALIDDADVMSKELSRKLKIHPNTLLLRIKKLEASGVLMKYSAVVDFAKAEKGMEVLMFLDVNMEKGWENALRPVAKIPEVMSFFLISGEHDVLLTARVRDDKHLAELMRKVQATRVVKKTNTHLIVDAYRYQYEYNPYRDVK